MRIGVISEGHSDRAVIVNLLKGIIGLDSSDVIPIRPEVDYDETDKAFKPINSFSTWPVVKQECEHRDKIEEFLSIEGQEFIVIHIDTAEADKYGVSRPAKDNDYCVSLRNLVKDKINEWLDNKFTDNILYAIAIEETDAWILTIYDKKDSTISITPKEKLQRILGKKDINSIINYDNYLMLSKPFSKEREIRKNKFLDYNCSLKLFYEEVQAKVL